jgi:aryl-alcohol dehydrogenase-like predicted oxidoreductase
MQTRRLGADGPEVSAIALGGMLLSITGRPPEDQSLAVIHAALEAGVTLIDTADAYSVDDRDANHNERLVAKALRGRRERVLVGTKVGCRRPGGAWTVDARPEHLVEAAHRCLESLGVDTIDSAAAPRAGRPGSVRGERRRPGAAPRAGKVTSGGSVQRLRRAGRAGAAGRHRSRACRTGGWT